MCGIIGYNGTHNAKEILIDGLKTLEYRGYDSSGIALVEKDKISVLKREGKLDRMIKSSDKITDTSLVGIGHTRWATHGKPNETNAHPHKSEDGKFCVVHNGIIENYSIIREALESKGYNFVSETDTEVIPQLLSYHYRGNVLEALQKTFLSLEGSFAAAILCSDEPDTIYAAKKSSPLIIGKGNCENLLASDICALAGHASKAVFLDDGEFAEIKKDSIKIFNSSLKQTDKAFQTFSSSKEENSKGNYEHFMLKEIFEQPQKIESLIKPKIKNGKIYLDEISELSLEIYKTEKIYIVGCGSAYNAALAGKAAIEELCRIPTEVESASEFRYRNPIISENTLVIIISQSGETADSIAAMRLANSRGASVLGIVNVMPSTIANECDYVIPTRAGREVAVATTKGYTTQLAALYMLALHMADIRKSLSESELISFADELAKISDKIRLILSNTEEIEKAAKRFSKERDIFFIGRNTDFAAAAEASLKLKEISYINCCAFPAGELKHGTIALIEKGTPVFAMCTNKRLFKKTLSNIEEVSSRGAEVLCVCRKGEAVDAYASIEAPDCPDIIMPLAEIIPMQLFAYFTAKEKGCNIDMPKNLAKSVTVE